MTTLTKNLMVSEIGRRTRLKNREVRLVLESLMEVWTESLARGNRIELEHLFVIETQLIDRGISTGTLNGRVPPRYIKRLTLRTSKHLKQRLKCQ